MDIVLKNDPVYDHFSKNKYLDSYKQSLVETCNVDHIVPFKHSNNRKGFKMDLLRQNNVSKLYPTSTCNELAREYFMKDSEREDKIDKGSPYSRKDVNFPSVMKGTGASTQLQKNYSNFSKQTIQEEGQESAPSDREKDPLKAGSRSSFTSTRRYGHKKSKDISEKEKVDKLIKIYFK